MSGQKFKMDLRDFGNTRGVSDIGKRFRDLQKYRGRLIGGLNMLQKMNEGARESGYDWDDFMHGDLPPPFDFLNTPPSLYPRDDPNGGLEPLIQEKRGTAPPDTIYAEANDGTWWAVPPPFEGGFAPEHYVTIYDYIWPPPGDPGFNSNANTHWTRRVQTSDPIGYPVDRGPQVNWDLIGWNGYLGWARNNNLSTEYGEPVQNAEARAINVFEVIPISPGQPIVSPPWGEVIAGQPWSGPTLDAVANPITRSPGSGVPMVNLPNVSWRNIHLKNALAELRGEQVDITTPRPDNRANWLKGISITTQPGAPPTKGPVTPPGRPVKGVKERKYKVFSSAAFEVAQEVFHALTEYEDLLDALYDALPKSIRAKYSKTILGKGEAVWNNFGAIDFTDALVNIIFNEAEDNVLGRGFFGQLSEASGRLGQPSYKIANPALREDGPLSQLGEGYGELSGAYINPTKEAIKAWLNSL